MPLHADDELPIWALRRHLLHRLLKVTVDRLQLEHTLQQSVIATDAQRLTPLRVCRQSDQIVRHSIVKAQSRADRAADAVLLVDLVLSRLVFWA